MQFTIEDIKDKTRLQRMIDIESNSIFNSPVARNNRSLEDIKHSVTQGKVAELYLIENTRFNEADLKWHDLKDPITGTYIEVKAYDIRNVEAPSVQNDLKRYRSASWCKSKWYVLFKVHEGKYELLEKILIK